MRSRDSWLQDLVLRVEQLRDKLVLFLLRAFVQLVVFYLQVEEGLLEFQLLFLRLVFVRLPVEQSSLLLELFALGGTNVTKVSLVRLIITKLLHELNLPFLLACHELF